MSYSGTIWCLFIWSILFLWGCDSQPNKPAPLILLDMVHDNPGEEPFKSAFKDPKRLAKWGYDGQVINDFTFIQTAATFRSYDPRIVPIGSEASDWIQDRINQVEDYINTCEAAGIDSYIFTDLFILPKTVLSLYAGSVQDAGGKFTLDLPKVRELHEAMFKELFERFPRLDGLVVRTGETYLNNMVHHTGNGPFAREISQEEGIQKHVQLINFLREEVCQKYDKKLVYRTWAFGGIHTDPDVYLAVTDQVAPHPNLYFSVKHTAGDYHRKFAFNPTLGIGSHHQIVEVQCQREYEGKSAHPNYIAQSVIEGFEEYSEASHPKGLRDLRNTENLAGIWTWSRGGGWKGPYIPHELWNEINAFVLARWAKNPAMRSQDGLREYAIGHLGLQGEEIERFQTLCRLSARGVIRGRSSLTLDVNPFWIRDEFMGGLVKDTTINNNHEKWGRLNTTFNEIIEAGKVEEALAEKKEAARIWTDIESLSWEIQPRDEQTDKFLKISCTYGRIKYHIIYHAWRIMLSGLQGEVTGQWDKEVLSESFDTYDRLWDEWHQLKKKEELLCPTLYKPYGFVYKGPDYHDDWGMQATVDYYRQLIFTSSQ